MTTYDGPVCRRCGAELNTGWRYDLLTAEQHSVHVGQDGEQLGPSLLRATSACNWNCLAVLAAIEAGPDADAAVQVVAERERQVTAEGWTPEHDDTHPPGEMAAAGAMYAVRVAATSRTDGFPMAVESWTTVEAWEPVEPPTIYRVRWPWDAEWWKPKSPERDLVRGAALVAAEADRLVRARRALQRDRF